MNAEHFQIRDPIHGVIFISTAERVIIDSAVFQRLRHIKQLGFAEYAFPCATHSRYSHSLGAMCMASKVFDRVIPKEPLSNDDWIRLRQVVRLAALLHDIGHPPLSHTTEMLMPDLSLLGCEGSNIKARHEDFTRKLILDSPLTGLIKENFSNVGVTAAMVASLLLKDGRADFFHIKGIDFTPVLRQIISSEIDADRMDYLLRDSFFCGVNYGKFDSDWLVENLVGLSINNRMYLGFKARALFAFEDFLLSRYHMFASVYLHHTPVIMEKMLERFFKESPESFSLSADLEKYILNTDLDLWQALRQSNNQWARRIVERRPFVMVHEIYGGIADPAQDLANHDAMVFALKDANIDVIASRSKSVLSAYYGKQKNPLYVENAHKKAVLLEEFSPLFVRYKAPAELFRIYVDRPDKAKAIEIIKKLSF